MSNDPKIDNWTESDLCTLYSALYRNTDADASKLKKYFPKKSVEEINTTIQCLKKAKPSKDALLKQEDEAPIEKWFSLAENTMSHNTDDYSDFQLKVLEAIIDCEEHSESEIETKPNFKDIYSYLAALFAGRTPPLLKPLDAAIILDLINSLAKSLHNSNLPEVHSLLAKKYKLLSCIPESSSLTASSAELIRIALTDQNLYKLDVEKIVNDQDLILEKLESIAKRISLPSNSEEQKTSSNSSRIEETSRESTNIPSSSYKKLRTAPRSSKNTEGDRMANSDSEKMPPVSSILPQQTELFSLNPLCIRTRVLKWQRPYYAVIRPPALKKKIKKKR